MSAFKEIQRESEKRGRADLIEDLLEVAWPHEREALYDLLTRSGYAANGELRTEEEGEDDDE